MNLKATTNSIMFKKKASKDAFYGLTGGSFSQKKKVVLGNIKHSGNKRDISLNKFGPSNNIYSDVKSLSGNNNNFNMSGRSLLNSAATTPKVKRLNTSAVFGSLLSFPNFCMDNNEVVLPLYLPISFDKKWVDFKIIKTPVEVSIKKLFTLDINFSAVKEKSTTAKTQLIKKFFSSVNGFGGATTSSKFEKIIQSTFISKKSMEITALLAREKEITINNNLKRQGIKSDWAVMIKKIPINTSKDMIVAAVSEFGEIKSIKIQLIGMWQKAMSFLIGKDSVRVAKAVGDCETWTSRDQFRALLFTLPMRTTAHNLKTLLERAGEKTCVINRSLETGNRICCTVVGFESDDNLESAFHTEPIYNRIKLSWARMNLVCCEKCRCFGYLALEYDISEVLVLLLSKKLYKKIALEKVCFWFAKLYEKKDVLISHPAAFSGKSWAQIVSLANFSSGAHFKSGSSFSSLGILHLGGTLPSTLANNSGLGDCLAVLECSLKLLLDQVSVLLKKLSFVELIPLTISSSALLLVASVFLASVLDSDMVLDNVLVPSILFSSVGSDLVANFSSSSSKVLITKVGGLESKMVALEAFINLVLERVCPWITDKFDGVCVFTSGLDSEYLGSGIAIVMDFSLAKHVCKVFEVPGRILSIKFLFKNKLSVLVLRLYTDASFGVQFSQTVNVVVNHDVMDIDDYFDTNYHAVSVLVDLGGLLNTWLNSLHRQANKDCWKFDFNGADNTKVMTDFGLTNGYQVHDGLDQEEVFLLLLWYIFYDPLLCEVKRQKSICGYKLNSYFVAKTGHLEFQAGLTSFFTVDAFVNNTIWIDSSQAATQHIFDVVSKFFWINNISINNDKTVAIPINCKVTCFNLFISSLSISIAKKEESHHYLGIFLSTEDLLKLSLAKTNANVKFFANLVLRKTISDKQFLYLVSAVLHLIVSYRIQFSFVPISSIPPVGVSSSYKNRFLRCLGSIDMRAGTAVFFKNISLGLEVRVSGLMSSTLAKLQAIILTFKCVFPNSTVSVFMNSQTALDACKPELGLADAFADAAFLSFWCLISCVKECCILAKDNVISGNSKHFVHGIFWSILHDKVWLVYTKHHVYIEKSRIIPHNSSAPVLVLGLSVVLSMSVIRLLSIAETFEATASSTTSKKKAPKSAFYGPAGGSFSQKKKVVLGNVKHSGDERDISLSRSGSGNSVYSDVKSFSGEDENVSMSGMNGGSLLGSITTTPKTNDLKKQRMRSDWAVIIKKISMNMPKNMIITAVSEFGEIKSIKIQLIGIWQKAVIEFAELDQANSLASKSLGLLADQVSAIMKKLSFVELVPLASKLSISSLVVPVLLDSVVNSDMTLDDTLASPVLPLLVVADTAANLSLSSSKILTTKMGGLESKLVALKVFSGLKVFSSGMNSEHCGSGVAIVLNDDFACHVCKISEVSGHFIFVCFLFAGKASVMIMDLYAGALAGVWFEQAFAVNALIASAISSSFYVFFGAVFGGCIGGVSDHFNTDYLAVLISVGLGGLLDKQLNILHKLANTDCWKFDFKNSNAAKWKCFDNCAAAEMLLLSDDFTAAKDCGNLNSMLELLIAKIVKTLSVSDSLRFVRLVKIWSVLNDAESSKISGLLNTCSNSVEVFKQLSVARKHYHKAKYVKSELAKNAFINKTIGKCMDDFVLGKDNIISSILEHSFHKVVLDYLVLDKDLILKLAEVKAKVDNIMVNWTRKRKVLKSVPDLWFHQYAPLEYVVNDAFSGVMNEIRLGELCMVVKNLLNGKAAGFSGVLNKLWKHSGDLVLSCLLDLLNSCLVHDNVPALWKCAWISMIPKSYE
ncbi:hypothetical protein G9A89_022002 [Geosiphon pyriformis]|nr:hypothetical protein G9A89_022002 [Geosiphon pyriformis]